MVKKIVEAIVAWIKNVVLEPIGSKKTIVAACAAIFFFPFSPAYSFGVVMAWLLCQTYLDKVRIEMGKKN